MTLSFPQSIYAFRHVVFDLDGTLIDSRDAWCKAFAASVSRFDVPRDHAERFFLSTTAQTLREKYAAILEQYTPYRLTDEMFGELEAVIDKAVHACEAQFFEGVLPLLRSLRSRQVHLFLSSASADNIVTKRLADGNATDLFTLALGSTAVPKGPRHVERFFRCLGEPPHLFAIEGVLVGDGENDMRMARAAGLYAIGVEGTVNAVKLRAAGAQRVVATVRKMLADPIP